MSPGEATTRVNRLSGFDFKAALADIQARARFKCYEKKLLPVVMMLPNTSDPPERWRLIWRHAFRKLMAMPLLWPRRSETLLARR